MIVLEVNEKAEISTRELIKGIEDMKPEDYFWIKDRLNLMKTFKDQVWHFKTSAFKLSKQDLKTFEILDFLRELNKIQSTMLKKLNQHENDPD